MQKNRAYLLLGSNEGDRLQWLKLCLKKLEESAGTVKRKSGIYQTAAWGLEEQPDFYNIAVCVETPLSPLHLLAAIQDIEADLGRQRTVKWGQRTLDIDILLYNNDIIDLPELKIPHTFMQQRRFALAPLNEIAELEVHPVLKRSIADLLASCPDTLQVHKLSFP